MNKDSQYRGSIFERAVVKTFQYWMMKAFEVDVQRGDFFECELQQGGTQYGRDIDLKMKKGDIRYYWVLECKAYRRTKEVDKSYYGDKILETISKREKPICEIELNNPHPSTWVLITKNTGRVKDHTWFGEVSLHLLDKHIFNIFHWEKEMPKAISIKRLMSIFPKDYQKIYGYQPDEQISPSEEIEITETLKNHFLRQDEITRNKIKAEMDKRSMYARQLESEKDITIY